MTETALDPASTVLITGGHGLLGRAVRRELSKRGIHGQIAPRREQVDFRDGAATRALFEAERPSVVLHLASVVFGLLGNMNHQLQALADSTLINHNVIMASAEYGVRKFFFAGSVASYPYPYPRLPLTESMFWNGVPHQGEFGYAHAKRHALAYLEILRQTSGFDFLYGILTNLYGPEDRFDETNGHVIPSLLRRLHRVMRDGGDFTVWGDGAARRDFMHVADAAAAIVLGVERMSGLANICSGTSVSIRQAVEALAAAAAYDKPVVWQTDKPVGVPDRSVSDAILRAHGFTPAYTIEQGISETWNWYKANFASAR